MKFPPENSDQWGNSLLAHFGQFLNIAVWNQTKPGCECISHYRCENATWPHRSFVNWFTDCNTYTHTHTHTHTHISDLRCRLSLSLQLTLGLLDISRLTPWQPRCVAPPCTWWGSKLISPAFPVLAGGPIVPPFLGCNVCLSALRPRRSSCPRTTMPRLTSGASGQ